MLAILAMGIFVLTCSAVGLRLLWIAARTGASAAWSCGLGFTLIALLGYPLSVASGNGTALVRDVDQALNAAGQVLVCAGLASFFAFTLTTFRMRAAWAWALTCTSIALLAVTAFGQIGAMGSAIRPRTRLRSRRRGAPASATSRRCATPGSAWRGCWNGARREGASRWG